MGPRYKGCLANGLYSHKFGRSVAQSGSAPYWGCGGRGFESRRSDHMTTKSKTFKKIVLKTMTPQKMHLGCVVLSDNSQSYHAQTEKAVQFVISQACNVSKSLW